MKHLIKSISLIGWASTLMFLACVNNVSEEDNHIQNSEVTAESSVETMLTDGFNQSTQLEQPFPSIEGAPSLSNQNFPLGKKSALGKSAAAEEEISIDSNNIEEGYAIVVMKTATAAYEKTDSIWVVWDEFAQDEIEDNENIQKFYSGTFYAAGKSEEMWISDADGDGIANGQSQYAKKVELTFSNRSILGVVEKSTMTVDAGPDANFDSEEDNKIISMEWEKSLEGETLAYAHFSDEDGDGMLVDKSFATNSVVKVEMYESSNPLKPLVDWSKLNLTVEMSAENEEGELISISGEEKFKNGIHNKIVALSNDGKENIKEAQIVIVKLTSDNPIEQDSSLHSEAVFVIDVGAGFSNESDNSVLEIHLERERKFGLIKSEEFHFVSQDPVMEGEEPTSGTIEILVNFKDGKSASLVGSFEEGHVEGTLTGPEGNTVSFSWTKP